MLAYFMNEHLVHAEEEEEQIEEHQMTKTLLVKKNVTHEN